jgi:hypothetical protein
VAVAETAGYVEEWRIRDGCAGDRSPKSRLVTKMLRRTLFLPSSSDVAIT